MKRAFGKKVGVDFDYEGYFGGEANNVHASVTFNYGWSDLCYPIHFCFGLKFLFDIYLTISHPRFKRFLPTRPYKDSELPDQRQIGLSWHDGALWVSLWERVGEWSRKDPWWWQFNINPANIIFGRHKYSEGNVRTGQATVIMPEGEYQVQYKAYDAMWKRPRLFSVRTDHRVDMNFGEIGVPIPGKGENSWDLDDDAIFEIIITAKNIEEAISIFTARTIKTRDQRGWTDGKLPSIKESS